jgi:hypothetical protein
MVTPGVLFEVRTEFLKYYQDELRLQRIKEQRRFGILEAGQMTICHFYLALYERNRG